MGIVEKISNGSKFLNGLIGLKSTVQSLSLNLKMVGAIHLLGILFLLLLNETYE
jgi:hypothetical protein